MSNVTITTVPVGTGMAILLPNGELNPAFVHALMRANELANTLPTEQWRQDSDMIFNQITQGDFPTFSLAQAAVVHLYMPAPDITRNGISHALGRLEKHYAQLDKT